MIKLILEGGLFSECEMWGDNRHGMLRIAEGITNLLVKNESIDISFINSIYLEKYHTELQNNINANYPKLTQKILSEKPSRIFNVFQYHSLYRKYPRLLFLPVKNKPIDNYDLIHSFYYPFTDKILKSNLKKCITLLDIIALKVEGYHPSLIKKTKEIVRSIRNNYAISISEFSREDLLNYDKTIDKDRIFVSPLAASKDLFYQNKDKDRWKIIQQKYSLPDQYFLCLSSSDLRKNIPHLIISFTKFILQEKPKDLYLVLAGNASHSKKLLDQLQIEKSARDRIIFTSKFIEDNDLASVYSNALSFFFLSNYEGFGLPVLEAMQCGTPTVSSNCTSIPELVGDAGIMLPPDDIDGLCHIMNELYNNFSLRDSLSVKGLQKAATFSWKRAAEEYSEIFKKICNL